MLIDWCKDCNHITRDGRCDVCTRLAGHSPGFRRGYATYLEHRQREPVRQNLVNIFQIGTPERSGFELARKDDRVWA